MSNSMNEATDNNTPLEKRPHKNQFGPQEAGPALVYFAAERTLLGWVRTALGLMAFGFVVDRFGLLLMQFNPGTGATSYPRAFSLWAGTALVISGVIMNVAAAVRYTRFMIRYRREGSTEPGHGLALAVFFTLFAAAAGTAIALFLITMSD
jgi:putative membrane protein